MAHERSSTFTKNARAVALAKCADYIIHTVRKNPEKYFDAMIKKLEDLDSLFRNQGQFRDMMKWIQSNNGTKQWFTNLLSKDPGQVNIIVRNFFGNCMLQWMEKAHVLKKKYGFCPPFSIFISPTMKCNLLCRNCYTINDRHTKIDDLNLDSLDRIIKEGKELGVYFYIILGGEPFIIFDDLSRLAEKHHDCLFMVFTNGTLITEDIADRLLELKNVVVAFSIKANRKETDDIRGDDAYDRMLTSIEHLRKRNLMYGISLVLTSENFDTIMSENFLNFWENQGAIFAWSSLYMPIGDNPDLSLIPTPSQRLDFGEFIKEYRREHPFFIMDLLADAPSVHGCIAAGRRLLHINNHGDVEPCIFARHATHNIHDCTLVEALQSPFFTFIRMNQPHTDNLLRPCMIIDNPEIWRTACSRYNAHPTQKGAGELITNPRITQAIDQYSLDVAEMADELWKNKYKHRIYDMYERKRSYGEGIDRIEFTLSSPDFLNKNRSWARFNTRFVKDMIEALTFARQNYGKDNKRHIQIMKKH